MKVSPYLAFNGNCAEVLSFYEQVFGVQAKVWRYKDAPSEQYKFPESTQDFIMHAQLEIHGEMIMLSDLPPEYPTVIGGNITIMVDFDTVEQTKAAFEALKDGGVVLMEPSETFWSKCFGSLTDKFGTSWNVSVGMSV